jgi:hypothetical protein
LEITSKNSFNKRVRMIRAQDKSQTNLEMGFLLIKRKKFLETRNLGKEIGKKKRRKKKMNCMTTFTGGIDS